MTNMSLSDALLLSYPNPFNAATVIPYRLAEPGFVRLVLYNTVGQAVRTLVSAERQAGLHQAVWNGLDDAGRPLATAVYLSWLTTSGPTAVVGKVALVR